MPVLAPETERTKFEQKNRTTEKKPRQVFRINNCINYFYLQKPVTKQIDYTIFFFKY